MIEATHVVAMILLGSTSTLFFTLKYVIDSNRIVNDFFNSKLGELEVRLAERTKEFSDITERASKANNSLGDRVMEYDKKMIDLENRISMLKMHSR